MATVAQQSPAPAAQKKQVNSRHKQYDEKLQDWLLVHDFCEGSRTVKEKGKLYLPHPTPNDTSKEATARYDTYRMRAVVFNATGNTLGSLVGQVFRKASVVNLTPRLQLIKDNIDGTGQSLEQLAKALLEYVLKYGRGGLLADYPTVDEGKTVTVHDLDSGNIRPKLVAYSPFRIINWRTKEIGANAVLSLVVLEEEAVTRDDGFAAETETQYRVLRLEDGGAEAGHFYKIEIWKKDAGTESFSVAQEFIPLDHAKKRFTFIPFVFIGSKENTPDCNDIPLYDLAELNRHHYMVSADYYESVFMVGQPTPVFSGLTKEWAKDVFKNQTIYLGCRSAIPLPENGKAELLVATPNTLAKEAMDNLEEQMASLGAQLVKDHETEKTATENTNDETKSTSVLAACANNVSEGVTRGLRMCAMFIGEADSIQVDEVALKKAGKKPDIYIELNTDFEAMRMSAEERAQLFAEWKGNGITTEEYRYAMTTRGIAFVDLETYKEQIEADREMFPDPSLVDPITGEPVTPGSKKDEEEPNDEE